MSDRSRNVIVGLTFLLALAVCMYGIILLGKFPLVGGLRQYQVSLIAPNANGISASSRIEFLGVYAGQVKSVYLTNDGKGHLIAKVELQIDSRMDIPASATASIVRSATGVGSPFVELTATDASGPKLAKDGTAILYATSSDSGLIPKGVFDDIHILKEDLGTTAHELTTVARDLHVLLAYTPPEAIDAANPADPNRPRENASTVIIRLNRTVKSLEDLLTDPKLQGSVREAVQNIADSSNTLKTTLEKISKVADNAGTAIGSFNSAAGSISSAATRASDVMDTTQKDIARVSQQLVSTLAELEKTVHKISEGEGTTGKLINDPRLYESLLTLSKSLTATVNKLEVLVDKWKDEGVPLHLK